MAEHPPWKADPGPASPHPSQEADKKACAVRPWPMARLECRPEHHKVTGLIPSPGTHAGRGLDPWSGACGGQPTDVSLWMSPPPLPSLSNQ